MKGYILDIGHERNKIKLLLENDSEKVVYDNFDPYFYLIADDVEKLEKGLRDQSEIKKAEVVRMKDNGKDIKVLKITAYDPDDIHELRRDFKELGELREQDIPYAHRYLIDKDLHAMTYYDFDVTNDMKLKEFKETKDKVPELSMLAFDIETNTRGAAPNPLKDAVILVSCFDGKNKKTFTWKGPGAYKNEREMLRAFFDTIKKKDPQIITGYNSGGFDFPFLKKRAHKFDMKIDLGKDGSEVMIKRGGILKRADMFGRVHLDGYRGVEFLVGIGAVRLPKNNLEAIYKEFFGKEKIDIDHRDIPKYWDAGGKDLEKLIQYNIEDTLAAYEIGQKMLPLYIELSKIIGLPLYEISGMRTSQMIEWILIKEAHKRNELARPRPDEELVKQRMMNPIKGAFVKLPEQGLHENIVVCDFRSLYPSLIIAYNLSPDTLNCGCCEDAHETPAGHRFCKKTKGLVPQLLEELIETRVKVKKQMEQDPKNRSLYFKQHALKILANTAYGYLGYGRARWYCREAAESATAYGRKHIHETIDKAEKAGFKVLYADTDSVFLKLGKKTQEDAKKFVKKINSELPEKMELEFEAFYPRGIFVTKREGGAAKKRYALIREDGTVEIKGFEFVRRDWADIAKKAQEQVIEAVLHEGKPEKAVASVKKVIQQVRDGKVDIDDLVIYTQLTRAVGSYEQQAPHVKAAKKLIAAGHKVPAGSVLEYVVVKGKGTISDRAIPVQLLGKKQYDADYYIDNQILPATMKILRELGVKEERLKYKGKQSSIAEFSK